MELPGLIPTRTKEIDPSKIINIRLTETHTQFLLSIPSICVSSEALEETTLVKAQNEKYKEVM